MKKSNIKNFIIVSSIIATIAILALSNIKEGGSEIVEQVNLGESVEEGQKGQTEDYDTEDSEDISEKEIYRSRMLEALEEYKFNLELQNQSIYDLSEEYKLSENLIRITLSNILESKLSTDYIINYSYYEDKKDRTVLEAFEESEEYENISDIIKDSAKKTYVELSEEKEFVEIMNSIREKTSIKLSRLYELNKVPISITDYIEDSYQNMIADAVEYYAIKDTETVYNQMLLYFLSIESTGIACDLTTTGGPMDFEVFSVIKLEDILSDEVLELVADKVSKYEKNKKQHQINKPDEVFIEDKIVKVSELESEIEYTLGYISVVIGVCENEVSLFKSTNLFSDDYDFYYAPGNIKTYYDNGYVYIITSFRSEEDSPYQVLYKIKVELIKNEKGIYETMYSLDSGYRIPYDSRR